MTAGMRRRLLGGGWFFLLVVVVSLAGCRPNAEAGGAATTVVADAAGPATDQGSADEYWQEALQEIYKSPLELTAQHEAEIAHGLHFRKLMNGDRTKRQIALTFDDGPHPQFTPSLLRILASYNAKATFFLVGEKAEQAPELVKQEVAAGHSIGNHTYHHVNLNKIPQRLVATEIRACGDVLKGITGQPPHLFRPPGGDYDRPVAETINGLGYTLVLWTDDPGDYASPGTKLIEARILNKLANGGIILIHDGVQQTVDVLPSLLQSLQRRGFEFVTVDEMLEGKCN